MPGGVWIIRSLVEKGLIGAALLAANCRSLNTLTIYWKDWRIAATTRSYRERAGLTNLLGSETTPNYTHARSPHEVGLGKAKKQTAGS
jgi:hypothetical protein